MPFVFGAPSYSYIKLNHKAISIFLYSLPSNNAVHAHRNNFDIIFSYIPSNNAVQVYRSKFNIIFSNIPSNNAVKAYRAIYFSCGWDVFIKNHCTSQREKGINGFRGFRPRFLSGLYLEASLFIYNTIELLLYHFF